MSADPRARWAEQLAVPVDAPPDEVAAAFLRALPGDLLPPAEHVLAASGLTGHALPTGRASSLDEVLGAELEAFAARFWSLPPAERLLEWGALSRRGAHAVRLRELEPGLGVTASTLDDPVAEELAEQFRALFVLPPRERAVRRAEWLLARADNVGRWRSALAVVQRDAPALVALEPRLRTALDATIDPAALAAGARESAVSADVADFTRRLRQSEAQEPRKPRRSRRERDEQWGRSVFGLFVIVMVLLFLKDRSSGPRPPSYDSYSDPLAQQLLRKGFSDLAERERNAQTTHGPSSTRKPTVGGTSPTLKPTVDTTRAAESRGSRGTVLPSTDTFTSSEVAACEHYESERRLGRAAVRPPVYEKWRAGRPPVQMREPGPNERRVNLSAYMIDGCQRSERTGRLPLDRYQYDDWVRAGKPSEPGDYIIPK